MSEGQPRKPNRFVPAPGAPPPGAPAVLWSQRARDAGEEDPGPGLLDRLVGAAFFAAWRLLGLLLWPWLWLHPRARRHVVGVLAPPPGFVWLHGASAGEHVAARALARVLGAEVWRTSSSWRTPVAGAFAAPLDLPFVVSRWLDRARPELLVLVEAELWPGWLVHCRRRGIPVAVVNARHGRGTSRLRRIRPLWRFLTAGVTFVPQERTGDLKLATELQDAAFDLGRDCFIASSTRPGDEARVLAAWQTLAVPRPLLVVAPRHLERREEVRGLLQNSGLVFVQRSVGLSGLANADVLLLDTIGELSTLYQQARAAFVGGTFDEKIGGHSPAEPFAAGLPVVGGPHQHSNPMAWKGGIALTVRATTGPDATAQLAAAIKSALSVGPQAPPDNEAAIRAAALLPEGHTPPERPARPWLAPAVPLVHAIGRSRRAYRGRPQAAPVPVVSVGALAAGGAGKTPATAWLAARLQERSGPEAVWVLGRGYRRAGAGSAVRSGLPGAAWDPAHLGDELELLRRRGIPVVSAPDRVAGAQEAARQGARLVLLDDGFQHRRLARDLDIVCVDAAWPAARGLIPVGERREPWSALRRAHWLWESHQGPPLRPGRRGRRPDPVALPVDTELPRVAAVARPVGWRHRGETLPLDAVGGVVQVAAGIARPERFLGSLVGLGLDIEGVRLLRDHAELGRLPPGCVVTEKDAARLPADADVFALLLDLDVYGGEDLVDACVALLAG